MRMKLGPVMLLVTVLLTLPACNRGSGVTVLPDMKVVSMDPERASIEGGVMVTITGENFFEVVSGTGFQNEFSVTVCGVPLRDISVVGELHEVVLPPGRSITLRMGDSVGGVLGAIDTGSNAEGNVIVTRPDGQQVIIEGTFDCYDPAPVVTNLQVSEPVIVTGETTFSWGVRSPDGEALACRLDPGDGSEPYAFGNCLTATRQTHTYDREGRVATVFTVTDAKGRETRQVLEVDVGNAPPEGSPGRFTTSEDAAVDIALSASDPDDDSLTFEIASPPANGTLSGVAPVLRYTPAPDFNGIDSFTYTVSDGDDTSAPVTVEVAVTPVNDAPVVGDVDVEGEEDVPIVLGEASFANQFNDVDGDLLETIVISSLPENGDLTLDGDSVTLGRTVTAVELAELSYHPRENWSGTDGFEWRGSDGTVASAPGTVNITVAPVNDVPIANAQAVEFIEDSSDNSITLTGYDVDGDILTYALVRDSLTGTLVGTAPDLRYTPDPDYFGFASIWFTVSDGSATSEPARVSVRVRNRNDPPVAEDGSYTLEEDGVRYVYPSASDPDFEGVDIEITAGPSHGTLELAGTTPTVYRYVPRKDYFGEDVITFEVRDEAGASDSGTIRLTIEPVDDDPTGTSQDLNVLEEGSLDLTLGGYDVDGHSLVAYRITSGPHQGTLSGSAPELTYSPATDFFGSDEFTFEVEDESGATGTGTVRIEVTNVNDPPVARSQAVSFPEGDFWQSIELDVNDVDGDLLTYILVTEPEHGVVNPPSGWTLYQADPNYFGSDSFSYKVSDGKATSETATVSITIHNVNDNPRAINDDYTIDVGGVLTVPAPGVLANDTDVDGDTLTASIKYPPESGTISLAPDGSFTYVHSGVPEDDWIVFWYVAKDGLGGEATASIEIRTNR